MRGPPGHRLYKYLHAVGLRFPCVPFLEEVLELFHLEIQHLHPNAMSRLAVFEWAFRTHGVIARSAEAFARTHLCWPSPKNLVLSGEKKTIRYASIAFLP